MKGMTSLYVNQAFYARHPVDEYFFCFVFSAWRHWGCVTKKIIGNIKEKQGEASEIDGFEDLLPEDQERVTTALENGEVALEDVPASAQKPDDGEEKPKKARKPTKKKADDEDEEKPKRGRAGSSKVCPIPFNNIWLCAH